MPIILFDHLHKINFSELFNSENKNKMNFLFKMKSVLMNDQCQISSELKLRF